MRISECINETYPETVTSCGNLAYICTFRIGFINPERGEWQGEGIANDETEFTFESLDEADELYGEFCRENDLPEDTVKYVEIVEEVH